MKSKLAIAALIAASFALVAPRASAQQKQAFESGNELYEQCGYEAVAGSTYGAYCIGYIAAIADSFNGVLIHIPPGATEGQMVDVVVQFLQANPAIRNDCASDLVFAALQGAFPMGAKTTLHSAPKRKARPALKVNLPQA